MNPRPRSAGDIVGMVFGIVILIWALSEAGKGNFIPLAGFIIFGAIALIVKQYR